jgi:hypothetical protein
MNLCFHYVAEEALLEFVFQLFLVDCLGGNGATSSVDDIGATISCSVSLSSSALKSPESY